MASIISRSTRAKSVSARFTRAAAILPATDGIGAQWRPERPWPVQHLRPNARGCQGRICRLLGRLAQGCRAERRHTHSAAQSLGFRTIPAAAQAQPSAWCSPTASSLTFTLHSYSERLAASHQFCMKMKKICLTNESRGFFTVVRSQTSQDIVRCTRRPAVTHEW